MHDDDVEKSSWNTTITAAAAAEVAVCNDLTIESLSLMHHQASEKKNPPSSA